MTNSLSKTPEPDDRQTQIAELLSRPNEFVEAARILIRKNLRLPALALVYTAIDILGWASATTDKGVQTSFTVWVDEFLFPTDLIRCSAVELYGARCAILHTLTAESKLSQMKGVRKVYYSWGSGASEDLQATIDQLKDPAVAVHIDHMIEALAVGIQRLQNRLLSDAQFREDFVKRAAPKWFTNLPVGTIKNFLHVRGAGEEYRKLYDAVERRGLHRPWEK